MRTGGTVAIPTGTTSRQLEAIGRWTLAGVVIVGMVAWLRPGYLAWGALAAALGVVWSLWLVWRTNSADTTVPGHPFHLALLGPGAILAWHLGKTGLSPGPVDATAVSGALNMSMIFQLAMVSLGVMLSQSLLPRAAGHFGVLSVCGAAMMGGTAVTMAWGIADAARSSVALLGFAGVCVWLTPLWGVVRDEDPERWPDPLRRRELRVFCLAAAAAGAGFLVWAAPHEALLAAGMTGLTFCLAGLIFHQRRIVLLLVGGAMAVLAAGVARLAGSQIVSFEWIPKDLFGRGENVFKNLSAADSGLAILAGAVGWTGLIWLVAGLAACTVWSMWRARRGHRGDQARAIVWTNAAALVSCALLAPAGPFSPAVTLAAALTWGLLPATLGRKFRPRPGAVLIGVLVVIMLLQGLGRRTGLMMWAAAAYGLDDLLLHCAAGFTLAMILSWYIGARKVWLGLLGIAVSVLAGGMGELAQNLISTRGGELADWVAHTIGAAAAIPLYLLAVGARWCESQDAKSMNDARGDYGTR